MGTATTCVSNMINALITSGHAVGSAILNLAGSDSELHQRLIFARA